MKPVIVSFLLGVSATVLASEPVIYQNNAYRWLPDRIEQGDMTATAVSDSEIRSTFTSPGKKDSANPTWTRKNDVSDYPRYTTPFPLEQAVYQMGLDEMVNAVEQDRTLRTGALWGGVWTRDVSYSIYLGMAVLQPTVAKNSLLRKINRLGKIVQDTGTGGSWPVSTDRMTWVIAGWEIYKVTGDRDWLRVIYPAVRASVEDDLLTVHDSRTGLVMGESSFLDWREQSYPRWMQPADILTSKCLGTNAVHYQALNVLAHMAGVLGKSEDAARYADAADRLRTAINKHLWMPDRGYYAQYLYGRNADLVSSRSETLGEALCVLFGIASPEQSREIIAKTPMVPFGPPIFYPQISGEFAYHNDAVWPFVTSFWMLAAARAGNQEAVLHAIGSTERAAALFCTNKENFRAGDGDWTGTHTNSSNMLWSLSGNLSIVFRVFFGMHFEKDRLVFRPFVPQPLAGIRTLTRFPYRQATLNLKLQGFGNEIRSFQIDGKESAPELPASLQGEHHIRIILADKAPAPSSIHLVENEFSLATPTAKVDGGALRWEPVPGATGYRVFRNGKPIKEIRETSFPLRAGEEGDYQVKAVAADAQLDSFASEPLVWRTTTEQILDAGDGRLGMNEITMPDGSTKPPVLTIPVRVDRDGTYAIDWLYSNGSGSTEQDNKCAIRTLVVDGKLQGVAAFPQRGKDDWKSEGWSNPIPVKLSAGAHQVQLEFRPENRNMNIDVNDAIIRKLRLTRLEP